MISKRNNIEMFLLTNFKQMQAKDNVNALDPVARKYQK